MNSIMKCKFCSVDVQFFVKSEARGAYKKACMAYMVLTVKRSREIDQSSAWNRKTCTYSIVVKV